MPARRSSVPGEQSEPVEIVEPRHRGARDALVAFLAYCTLTIALTWPLTRGLARDVAGDFGDPLLNCWILAWDADHLLRALGGDLRAVAGYWHANIYYPNPYALAYSEHLTPQALQILPVWALTKNALLCYNLVLLSTFAFSGLGVFLLVRELTGNRAAAFLAGLAYAFAPYRFSAITHLQVLSSQWMPFALLGFRRFFATGRVTSLAGGAAAWIAQNLSCAYYLAFFSPVMALFVFWELTVRRLWTDARTLRRLATAGAAVVLATLPFAMPYFAVRRLGFPPRSLEETDRFAADLYSYLTADSHLWLWGGTMRSWPKVESSLFPGLTIMVLAIAAVVTAIVAATRRVGTRTAVSPDSRSLRERISSPVGLFAALTCFAVAMSFGPHIQSRGKLLAQSPLYLFFYRYVPGFDGLRVPARFGMIVALGLAALAGYGASRLRREGTNPTSRLRHALAGTACALIVFESVAVPLDLNDNWIPYTQPGLAPLPAFVSTGKVTPPVYQFVANLPASTVLIELPLGEVVCDARYMFYSTTHWRRLVNGYSGGAPASYAALNKKLQDPVGAPERAWQAVADSRATHVIVHEATYLDGYGGNVSGWLRDHGAHELFRFRADHLFELPRRSVERR
jgi:hypothetical protein